MTLIYPVILCGGSGTRLWPLSRQSMPKQFLNLIGDNSLFQQAAQRVSGVEFASPLVITSNEYRFIAAQQLADIGVEPNGLILEPSAKNTAPAIFAAAEILYGKDEDALLMVMPSDHFIPDHQALADLVLAAKSSAETGSIITFGIQPDRPETGYGYIERGAALSQSGGYSVTAFHEKPDESSAKAMLASGKYFWNTGLFLTHCGTLTALAETLVPDMLAAVRQSVVHSTKDLDFLRLEQSAWQSIEPESIDYAIMEKAENLVVFPYSGRWSDLGDWQALRRELVEEGASTDSAGNLLVGKASQTGSQACLIWADSDEQVVTTVGMKDTIVVAMKDAVLVMDAARTQALKQVVDLLGVQKHSQAHEQVRRFRPWGWFETIFTSNAYEMRRVVLRPLSAMSQQVHNHRSEHWMVVHGVGEVELEDNKIILTPRSSVDIAIGQSHRLLNNSNEPLEIVEIRIFTEGLGY